MLPPLPVAVPLLVAALILGSARKMPRWMADALAILTSLGVLAICVKLFAQSQHGTIVYWYGGWKPHDGVAIGISFAIDPLGAAIAGFTALIFLVTFVYSWWYFEDIRHVYHVIMLCFMASMCGFALTGDLFNMFVWFELMSAAAFCLCGYKIEEDEAMAGTINFAVTNTVGAFFTLVGIALIYGRTGALNMAQIGAALENHRLDGIVVVAFALICFGFAVKGAIAPLHLVEGDAHAVAPTPLAILFSGIMVQIALFGIARVYWAMFAPVLAPYADGIRGIFVAAGVITILIGGLMAFLQTHLKRLLAFSTVSHSGIFLCAFGLLTPFGLTAMVAYIVSHGLVKSSLFMGTGILLRRHGTLEVHEMVGKSQGKVWGALLFLAGGLGLTGLPPFGDFVGKVFVEHAGDAIGYAWIAAALIVGSALDGGAVIKAALQIYFGLGGQRQQRERKRHKGEEEGETGPQRESPPWTMTLPSVFCLALAITLGAWSKPFDLFRGAAQSFVDSHAYQAAVLSAKLSPVATMTNPRPDPFSYDLETITLILAFVFTLISVWPTRKFERAFRKPVKVLRAMHSGMFPDYVAWMTAGAGVFAIALFAIFRDRL